MGLFFKTKGWTGKGSYVVEVPLRYLRPSIIYFVPCDWIVESVDSLAVRLFIWNFVCISSEEAEKPPFLIRAVCYCL